MVRMIEQIAGKHEWRVSGDFACSTQDQTISLSLRLFGGLFGWIGSWKEMKELKIIKSFVFSSCSSEEFTCTDGVCIDLIKRFLSLFVFVYFCVQEEQPSPGATIWTIAETSQTRRIANGWVEGLNTICWSHYTCALFQYVLCSRWKWSQRIKSSLFHHH